MPAPVRRTAPARRTAVALAAALAAQALGGGAPLRAATGPAALPANIPAVPNFDAPCTAVGALVVSGFCSFDAALGAWTFATPARESAALRALDAAQALVGLPPLALPADWSALSPEEQQFVLVDLERVDAGLPPLVAEAPALDAIALTGAEAGADPQPVAPWTAYSSASNWADDAQPAVALYGYLFLDGWGGSAAATPNLDCAYPGAPGCWGHRRAVLGDYGRAGLLGVGTVAGQGTSTGSSAQFFLRYDGPPIPVDYTWADALAAGAGGGAPDPAAGSDPPGQALWPFADLDGAAWAAGPAAALALLGVVDGTAPGTFSPEAPVQLEELAAMLGRALGWSETRGAASPPAGTAAYAAAAMSYAAGAGLLPPGLPPDAALTRAEAAELVVSALGLPPAAAPPGVVVPPGLDPAEAAAVATAAADGLLRGTGGGALASDAVLSRADAAVLLLRALLARVRAGASGLGSAQALAGGAVLYRLGGLEALAPAAGADPVAYWAPGDGAFLGESSASWWNGTVVWTPGAPPSWGSGATDYGTDVASLWAAGQAGIGPALFRTKVRVIAFGAGDVQELLPGASAWAPVPPAAAGDPGLAVALDLLP